MNLRIFLSSVFTSISVLGIAQESVHKKFDLFIYTGYNRSAFTRSDFHISGEGYDLVFRDVAAQDAPTPFSFQGYFTPGRFSIPQYTYRFGLYLNKRWSISVGLDHMKYYMITNQNLNIEGEVSPAASEKYAGVYGGSPVEVPWRFLWFHHSDGLNYGSVELEYNYPVWVSKKSNFSWELIGNGGLGLYVPKTFVQVFDEPVDNKFHLAGYGLSAKVGTRFNFFKHFYLEASSKNGFAILPSILVNNEKSAQAKQRFGWTQFFGAVGFNIPLNAKQESDAQKP